MKTIKFTFTTMLAIGFLAAPSSAKADFKSSIIDSCSAYQQGSDAEEVNACKLYIDGFIDSSLLAEEGVVKPKSMIKRKQPEQTDYIKRVYNTRLFSRDEHANKMETYQFCIPREYDRKAIASNLAKSLDISALNNRRLKDVVFTALITKFPCRANA